MTRCRRCGHENRPQAKFCEECAAPLARRCTGCGSDLTPTAKFCPECAHPTGVTSAAPAASRFAAPDSYTPKHLAEKILTSKAALEGERKQITVLFCDIVNSTPLAESLGAEGMHELLNEFFDVALDEIHRYEGTVNQFLGDGFMALFGAPIAHEDHARRAALAALDIRGALEHRRVNTASLGWRDCHIRMGLNSGSLIVGKIGNDLRMDYTAIGDTTNIASRIQSAAAADEILLSDSTRRLIEGYIDLEKLPPAMVKGKREPIQLYKIVGVGKRRSPIDVVEGRRLTPFVGRSEDMAVLNDALQRMRAGHGGVVEIEGDPGVGKSRLVHEFLSTLQTDDVAHAVGRCLSYGRSIPYLPILQALREYCGIDSVDEPTVVATKLHHVVEKTGRSPADDLPYLLHFLGIKEGAERLTPLDPATIKGRTFEVLRASLVQRSRQRPLVLLIEDLHWIDASSLEFLAELMPRLALAHVLLIVTFRPDFSAPWSSAAHVSHVVVRPLSQPHSAAVLDAALGSGTLPPEFTALVLKKGEGNPFFLEELARSLSERHGHDGMVSVPDTVQGVLAARIDRLPEEDKRLLESASVLGREFTLSLLAAVWPGNGLLVSRLRGLARSDFLYEGGSADEPVYAFKHALTQDVAYETLLQHRRRELHGRVVNAIETLHTGRLMEHVEHLAYHAFRDERWPKAVTYARDAGRKAAARYANREAVAMFEQALAALEHLPEHERESAVAIDLRFDLKNALVPLGEWRRALPLLDQAEQLARAANDRRRLGWILMHQGHGSYILGDFSRAREQEETALDIAVAEGDTALAVGANYYLAHASYNLGDYATAARIFARTISGVSRESTGEPFGLVVLPASSARSFQAHALALMGDFDAALSLAAEGITIGETVDHPLSIVLARLCAGTSRVLRGDFAGAIVELQRGKAVCEEKNIPYMSPLLDGLLGWAQSLTGSPDDAIAMVEESDARARAVGFMVNILHLQPSVIEAQVLARQFDRADRCARSALTLVRHHRTRGVEALLLRLLGTIAAERDTPDFVEAEQHYRDALELASDLRMRPLVADCHAALAKLYRRTGKHRQGHEHFTTAAAMYRDMGMTYWLEKLTKELETPSGGG
jgi:class 3 adenylate cyclase/tetratricopeptide (TPR) repeat protein